MTQPPHGWKPHFDDVLRLLAAGASQREIAKHMSVSESTAKVYTRDLIRALGAVNRPNAVALAYERGMLGSSAIPVDVALAAVAKAVGYVATLSPTGGGCPAGTSCYALDPPPSSGATSRSTP